VNDRHFDTPAQTIGAIRLRRSLITTLTGVSVPGMLNSQMGVVT
jgi:hypothetical protein